MQDSYKHGTKGKNYTVNGVINLDLSDVLIRGAIDQLMLVRSVSSYLENKKRGAKPSKIEISKNDAINLDFWKKNFSFMLNDPSIKLLLKTGKEQKLEVKRIIANVINLEVNQEINQYSHEEFFKGMSDFIKAKQIATPEDQNNLANTGVLTMLDMLGRKPKIETWKRLKALDISTEDFKVNARLDIEKPVIDEEGEEKMMIETGITSEEWSIGDVIVSEKKQGIALIVKDNDGMYCAMDIDGLDKSVTTYSTEDTAIYYCGGQGYFRKLGMMQSYFATEGWHKVKAVLKVQSNIELGGKEKC